MSKINRSTFKGVYLARLAVLIFALLLVGCRAVGALAQPAEVTETLFQGIEYQRQVRSSPRPMVIHIVTVDLKAEGIKPLVTPPADENSDQPLEARTTSEFLEDYGLQLAINGDAFHPWWIAGPFYYPHDGDPVSVYGFAASKGTIYAEDTDHQPTLYIYKNNKASINSLIGKVYNAISGTHLLVKNGKQVDKQFSSAVQPRTAIGLDKAGRHLIIIVVDGRQPGYSEGVTLAELAQLLLDNNAEIGFNLDGGGSTTLVISDKNGHPLVLNSPIQQGIPGRERPVANHLGFYAKGK